MQMSPSPRNRISMDEWHAFIETTYSQGYLPLEYLPLATWHNGPVQFYGPRQLGGSTEPTATLPVNKRIRAGNVTLSARSPNAVGKRERA
jgi:hypothetical protein